MNWMTLWTLVLGSAVGLYALIVIFVAIGGARDLKALFQSLGREVDDGAAGDHD